MVDTSSLTIPSGAESSYLEQFEVSRFIDHIRNIREQRLDLQRRLRQFSDEIGPHAPVFPLVPMSDLIDLLADSDGLSEEQYDIQRTAIEAKEVLAAVDILLAEHLALQRQAMNVPGNDDRMKQIGLLYAAALDIERQAWAISTDALVYGGGNQSAIPSLLATAASVYAGADRLASTILADAHAEGLMAPMEALSARIDGQDF
ncbi:MAG: hypothetical protein IH956_06405 [Chloroflexi bacterium]|nr:hypothetical protein [Chloroflexota bacterium]